MLYEVITFRQARGGKQALKLTGFLLGNGGVGSDGDHAGTDRGGRIRHDPDDLGVPPEEGADCLDFNPRGHGNHHGGGIERGGEFLKRGL